MDVEYRVIDKEKYYRGGVFRHFTEDCKCSTSMTARIDVTDLVNYSKQTSTKFYINFLYVLSKVLNSRDDYRMGYIWQSEELICYNSINPIQYIFHEDTETCTPVYTTYYEDYETFYRNAASDVENAKNSKEYKLDMVNHPNWFDASSERRISMIKNDYIAYCGLDCETCEARLATVKNDNELRNKVSKEWSELNGVEITPEMINCTGCRMPGVKTVYCDSLCLIRQCAMQKQVETCGDCPEMESCEKVGAIIGNNADARDRLEGRRNA